MSFEHNPADEDREAYDNGLMAEEIKSLQDTIAAQAAEIERLTKEAVELQRDYKGLQVIATTFDKMHWKLVDLFDPEMRGVSPLHYVEEQIAALRSQLEEQRKRLEATEPNH